MVLAKKYNTKNTYTIIIDCISAMTKKKKKNPIKNRILLVNFFTINAIISI